MMEKYQEILNELFPNQYVIFDEWDEKDEDYEVFGIWDAGSLISHGEDVETLKNYSPDFYIWKVENQYMFAYVVQSGGSYWQPPDFDVVEDKNKYETEYEAFMAMIHHIVDEQFSWRFNEPDYEK